MSAPRTAHRVHTEAGVRTRCVQPFDSEESRCGHRACVSDVSREWQSCSAMTLNTLEGCPRRSCYCMY
eukprot:24202-Rhodomonas_salina.4